MKKKCFLLILTAVLCLGLCACKVELASQRPDYYTSSTSSADSVSQEVFSGESSASLSANEQSGESEQTTASVLDSTEDKSSEQLQSIDPVTPSENPQKPMCTLSIECKTILEHLDKFNKDKLKILPKDGVIYKQRQLEFNEGDSVFDLLNRETRKNRIHMDFVNTPLYNSNYIKGIANIYERDCGENSGWTYRVNGEFPSCGVSKYKITSGDKIELLYTIGV
ncbi:MAG: DUF4430 domain-containing protein [Oscillospiraceae bacterium]